MIIYKMAPLYINIGDVGRPLVGLQGRITEPKNHPLSLNVIPES
jgi:hypothetical protein